MENKIIKHNVTKTNGDSLTLSSVSKGGEMKIYGDYNNPEEFKKKIDNAISCRQFAQLRMDNLK